MNHAGYDSYLGINGREGRVVWPDLEPRLLVESPPGPARFPVREQSFDVRSSTSYGGASGEDFFRQFLTSLEGKVHPPTTLADAVRTARVVEAAEESSRNGRFVRVSRD